MNPAIMKIDPVLYYQLYSICIESLLIVITGDC